MRTDCQEKARLIVQKYNAFIERNILFRFTLLLESVLSRFDPEKPEVKNGVAVFMKEVREVWQHHFLSDVLKSLQESDGKPEALQEYAKDEYYDSLSNKAARHLGEACNKVLVDFRKRGMGFHLEEDAIPPLIKLFRKQNAGELVYLCELLISVVCPEHATSNANIKNYTVRDVLGRFILMPVERYFGITDDVVAAESGTGLLFRGYCGPVLQAVKSRAIGPDKYASYNQYYFEKLMKALPSMREFTNADVETFFKDAEIRRAFSGLLLTLLRKMTTTGQRATFVKGVNSGLKGQAHQFSDDDLNLIFRAWATFVAEHAAQDAITPEDGELLGTCLQ